MFFRDDRGREHRFDRNVFPEGPFAWYQSILLRDLKGQFHSAKGAESKGDMLALILKGTLPDRQKLIP